jgi:hypothetical protein
MIDPKAETTHELDRIPPCRLSDCEQQPAANRSQPRDNRL